MVQDIDKRNGAKLTDQLNELNPLWRRKERTKNTRSQDKGAI